MPSKPDNEDYLPQFGTPVTGWFRWFAWRPVRTLDRGVRWLVPVYKRRCQTKAFLDGPHHFWFQHAVAGTDF